MTDPAIASFVGCLTRIGFNTATREFIVAQGYGTAQALATLPYAEIDDFVRHMTRVKAPQGDREEGEVVTSAEVVSFPFASVRALKALRLWLDYRILRGEDVDLRHFGASTLVAWLARVGELQQLVESDKKETSSPPPAFTSFAKWPAWEETFLTYLAHVRGAASKTPLTYVIRSHTDVTREMRGDAYGSIDDDLINTIVLDGPRFRVDNKWMYAALKPLVVDGPGWPFIQPFNRTQNGRGAFLALKQQAEGQSAVTTRKAKAYADLSTAQYTGKGKYTFDQYVSRHQKAHNELESLGEPVAETKKVADFIKGISDPKLETGKSVVDGDEAKLTSFEACQQYFKTLIENMKSRVSGSQQRQVSGVNVGGKKPNKAAGSKKPGPKGKGKPRIHAGHYTAEQYRALTDEERQQVKVLREQAKKRKAGAVEVDDADSRQVSGVASKVDDELPETEVPTESPADAQAGTQFGRKAYKKAKSSAAAKAAPVTDSD
jgi:hypothetical protein